jgi:hypothetical protein
MSARELPHSSIRNPQRDNEPRICVRSLCALVDILFERGLETITRHPQGSTQRSANTDERRFCRARR